MIEETQKFIVKQSSQIETLRDTIETLEAVRVAALNAVMKHEESVGASDHLYLAHRILAKRNPKG